MIRARSFTTGVLLAALSAGWVQSALAEEAVAITALEWAEPRSGESIARHPKIAPLVRRMIEKNARLQIRYPGGDMGRIWANELQAWLVALGIPSAEIERMPGSRAADIIELVVTERISGENPIK